LRKVGQILSMKVDTIKAIFTNLLFVVGVILLIYGFIQGSLTIARSLIFDQYPLNSYEETRCEYEFAAPKETVGVAKATPSGETANQSRQTYEGCQQQLNYQRKIRQTEHIVGAVSTFAAGLILVVSFKRFIFDR